MFSLDDSARDSHLSTSPQGRDTRLVFIDRIVLLFDLDIFFSFLKREIFTLRFVAVFILAVASVVALLKVKYFMKQFLDTFARVGS